jgi:tetratricopeptide (TPR) repeat protein
MSMRHLYLAGWGYTLVASAMLYRAAQPQRYFEPAAPLPTVAQTGTWYDRVRPHCNSLEVELTISSNPPPADFQGQAYAAACYALAGKIARAAERINALNEAERQQAASIVFEVGHPVADAGDDEAAGPIMQLVIEYLPTHYMALYHAGIAQYRTGKNEAARHNLTEFLKYYQQDDGWTNSAKETLRAIAKAGS